MSFYQIDRNKDYMKEIIDEGDIEKIDTNGKPKTNILTKWANGRVINARLRDQLYRQITK